MNFDIVTKIGRQVGWKVAAGQATCLFLTTVLVDSFIWCTANVLPHRYLAQCIGCQSKVDFFSNSGYLLDNANASQTGKKPFF